MVHVWGREDSGGSYRQTGLQSDRHHHATTRGAGEIESQTLGRTIPTRSADASPATSRMQVDIYCQAARGHRDRAKDWSTMFSALESCQRRPMDPP